MFLWVENGTWPSLDPRQEGGSYKEGVGLEKALRVPHSPLFLVQVPILESGVLGNSHSSGPVPRVSYCWRRTISYTAPILSFMKALSLFNMQGPKVNHSKKTIRGPNKVDMRVVNQGEE